MWVKENIFFAVLLISLSFLFTGCAAVQPRNTASQIAQQAGLTRENVQTNDFLIASWSRMTPPVRSLHVYIEGDGFAWQSRTRPSDDPTPHNPVGLTLAAADTQASVLYLARPCQFAGPPLPAECSVRWWTEDRFSPVVLESMNEALDRFVARYPGVQLDLTGYSGGGNIAALLAERRTDVRSLRTVAGNLDVAYVNALHQVSAMPGAINAIDRAQALRHIPQLHLSGEADKTVPPDVARRFVQAVGGNCIRTAVISGMSHGSDWAAIWPQWLAQGVPAC
ncbi:alpha/beta hydrolase [Lelliottia sp. V106_10]|uniref:alpha/beta fold hydrolase n=1 Tax=Lelliottia TaxID=1330545 RepID=UPI00254E020C|nr:MULTISPECIES: alpha/beta hydrolase [unclassified Lelliottia]MDK9354905.1 alpha/beta hydrolase [Lelliottia sp. V106_16]MDK9372113.1 alpha/beta hydrolase [Lelliottia sp. V106_10]MDK9598749.1 alpha/beta hydrolase [Lelliottia sp. V106_5]